MFLGWPRRGGPPDVEAGDVAREDERGNPTRLWLLTMMCFIPTEHLRGATEIISRSGGDTRLQQ